MRPPPPAPPFGKSCIRPWENKRQAKKKKKRSSARKKKKDPHGIGSAGPIAYATFATRLIRHCNEVTLIICLGLISFLKFAPISWAGAPSKACARGPWSPPPPPLATPLVRPYPLCHIFVNIFGRLVSSDPLRRVNQCRVVESGSANLGEGNNNADLESTCLHTTVALRRDVLQVLSLSTWAAWQRHKPREGRVQIATHQTKGQCPLSRFFPSVFSDGCCRPVNRLSDGRELTVSAGRLAKRLCPLNQSFFTYVSLPFDVHQEKWL